MVGENGKFFEENMKKRQELFANFLAQGGGSDVSVREEIVAKMIVDGKSYEEIGVHFDVTRERIRQIADKAERKISTTMRQRETEQRVEDMKKKGVSGLTIDDLILSPRAYNGLKNAGVSHVSQLADFTEGEMLCIKNFGRKSLNELKYLGIQFKGVLRATNELTETQHSDLDTVVAGIKKLGGEEAREVSLCLLTLLMPFAVNNNEVTNLIRHLRDRLLG